MIDSNKSVCLGTNDIYRGLPPEIFADILYRIDENKKTLFIINQAINQRARTYLITSIKFNSRKINDTNLLMCIKSNLVNEVDLAFCSITITTILTLSQIFPCLKTLSLERADIASPEVLESLLVLPKLSYLNLSSSHLTDEALAYLVNLTNLSSLKLSGCSDITDVGLSLVCQLTKLFFLDLSCCENITNDGLVHLIKLSRLSWLDLFNCENINGAGLVHLTSLRKLSSFRPGGNTIRDDELIHLSNLTRLSSLDLSCCHTITNDGLTRLLPNLPNLSSLTFGHCNPINDTSLALFAKLTNLSSLDVACCGNITDDGLIHMTKLTNLSFLDLSNCNHINDTGFIHLANLTNLHSLNLSECNISNVGLAYLSHLNLAFFNLYQCENINQDGLNLLFSFRKIKKFPPMKFTDHKGIRHYL